MATTALQSMGGGLGALLGALTRNKQAAATGEPKENVLQAAMAGMGGEESLEQYHRDRDERQFLTGLAEQIAAQAKGTGLEAEVADELSKFHSANLNKQRAIISGLGTRLKKWEEEATARDVQGLASDLAAAAGQSSGPPAGLMPEDAAAWAAASGGAGAGGGPTKLNAADIANALSRYPRAAMNPNVANVLQTIMREQNKGELTPYQREMLEMKRQQLMKNVNGDENIPRLVNLGGRKVIVGAWGQYTVLPDMDNVQEAPEGYELWTGPDGKQRLLPKRQTARVLPERLADELVELERQLQRSQELAELPDAEANLTYKEQVKAAGGLAPWREQQKKKVEKTRQALATFVKRWRSEGYGKEETWQDVLTKAGLTTEEKPPGPAPTKYKTDKEVAAALKAGELTREQALKILREQFGYE